MTHLEALVIIQAYGLQPRLQGAQRRLLDEARQKCWNTAEELRAFAEGKVPQKPSVE